MRRSNAPRSNGQMKPSKDYDPASLTETDDLLSPGSELDASSQRSILWSFGKHDDPSTSWFYQPSTLTIFGTVMIIWAASAYYTDSLQLATRLRSHLGLLTAVASFLVFCVLQVRDGPFRRPHPAFWRVVLGLNMLYWLALCFLLYQDKHWARQALRYFDEDLGQEVHHKDFGESCEFTVENVKSQALEIFSLAHALGWFGKALILRDWWLIIILSISYELIEYSFAHQLPEFNECWWDHWLLDVAGCNFIGSWIGMKACKFLEVSHFSWRGRNQHRRAGIRDSSARLAQQFTPFDFADFSWDSVKRFRNYASTVVLLAVFLLSEIDIFYLKHLLWLPSDHPFVVIRLAFMFLWALPATREYYEYVNHSKQIKRMGFHAWLLVATVMLEFLIVVKWSEGEFPKPAPRYVKVCWTIVLTALVVYPLWKFGLPSSKQNTKRRREPRGSRS